MKARKQICSTFYWEAENCINSIIKRLMMFPYHKKITEENIIRTYKLKVHLSWWSWSDHQCFNVTWFNVIIESVFLLHIHNSPLSRIASLLSSQRGHLNIFFFNLFPKLGVIFDEHYLCTLCWVRWCFSYSHIFLRRRQRVGMVLKFWRKMRPLKKLKGISMVCMSIIFFENWQVFLW